MITWEEEFKEESQAAAFRDNVYLHSIAGHVPGLYQELFEESSDRDGFEWEIPESPEDLQRMMAELASVGIPVQSPGFD